MGPPSNRRRKGQPPSSSGSSSGASSSMPVANGGKPPPSSPARAAAAHRLGRQVSNTSPAAASSCHATVGSGGSTADGAESSCSMSERAEAANAGLEEPEDDDDHQPQYQQQQADEMAANRAADEDEDELFVFAPAAPDDSDDDTLLAEAAGGQPVVDNPRRRRADANSLEPCDDADVVAFLREHDQQAAALHAGDFTFQSRARAPLGGGGGGGAARAAFGGAAAAASASNQQAAGGPLAQHVGPRQNAAAIARCHAQQLQAAPPAVHLMGGGLAPQLGWQATKNSLKERFSFMFCNEILADVHFIVGRGDQRQRVPAHKFVLSVGSAVFDAMFNGAMAGADGQDDIELPDVEPAAFLALLKFLYSDDVQIGPESVMTTLYTAKKYAVPALEAACVDFLKRNMNAENSFMLLTQARLFDEPQLAALCLETIDKHTSEALSAEGFADIDLDTLCAVLERDTLRIREATLYQSVVRWSVQECHRQQRPVAAEHQRSLLGRALALIRFPLMTVEEFAQSAAQSGILTDRELVNLFLYFTVNPKPSVGFLDVPRCCVTGKEQSVNRFQRIEGRWGYSGTPDRIKFTVDRRIFVVGFGLYGSIHGPIEYQVTIQILHCGTGKVLGSNETSFNCDGSSATFRVLFKEPVEINPHVTYIASACLKGPDSHYGTKGLRRIVHQSPVSGCVTFQFTYAAGNNNGTSVEDGQIPDIIFYTKLS